MDGGVLKIRVISDLSHSSISPKRSARVGRLAFEAYLRLVILLKQGREECGNQELEGVEDLVDLKVETDVTSADGPLLLRPKVATTYIRDRTRPLFLWRVSCFCRMT